MARTGRPGLIQSDKNIVRKLWKEGKSFSDIGRVVNKHAGSIFGVLKLGALNVPLPGIHSF